MLHLPQSETGANVSPLPISRDPAFAAAFRDLESAVCDCAMMARIAATLLAESDNRQYPPELYFAVTHASEMIDALKDKYYSAFGDDRE
ncbi:hypothetical protein [Bradyrhizobium ottawaense]|uniref:hypothetical protein n=1 Tax=Bradyrhizobium ottawaense TaxID=931866 RepID=UPI0030F380EA